MKYEPLLFNFKVFLYAKAQVIPEEKPCLQSRLQDVYAIMDGLKNHQIVYNDELVRQIIEVVIVESKEKIKIIFKDGLTVEENL